jgi:hypothetical protein
MKWRTGAAAIAMTLTSPAVAANYQLHIQPTQAQVERFEDGRQLVDSPGTLATVRAIPPKTPTPGRSGVRLYVSNHGARQFNFGPANVTIKLADGSQIAVLSYDDMAREERRREGRQRFGAAMAAAARSAQASDAGAITSYGSYTGNTVGTFGSKPINAATSGFGTVTTYDPARTQLAQAAANEENRADAASLAQAQAVNRSALDMLMQTNTVDPGASAGGGVLFDPPKAVKDSKEAVPITIIVDTGGERHQFAATIQKVK